MLGSVHKYFGGGLGNWKFLLSNFFDPPLRKPPKLFEPPLNMCENFFDPPPHCYMYNISVFLQHQFILYAPQMYQYYW